MFQKKTRPSLLLNSLHCITWRRLNVETTAHCRTTNKEIKSFRVTSSPTHLTRPRSHVQRPHQKHVIAYCDSVPLGKAKNADINITNEKTSTGLSPCVVCEHYQPEVIHLHIQLSHKKIDHGLASDVFPSSMKHAKHTTQWQCFMMSYIVLRSGLFSVGTYL